MTTPRRRGRRVPPKARGPRPQGAFDAPRPADAGDAMPGDGPSAGLPPDGAPERRATRSQNRAAKRAATPERRRVQGGGVRGRGSRSLNPAVAGLAIAAVLIGVAVLVLGNPFGGGGGGGASPSASAAASAAAYGDGTCPTSQPAPLAAGDERTVTIETEKGDIVIRVQGSLAPIATGNFVALVECEYYDGVVFHRTATMQDGVPFVIQGGDPDGTGSGPGPGYRIADDPVTATYRRGTVAMARTQQPNSQGSQFFIVLDDRAVGPLANANTYAILGEVVSGMEVADAIYQASGGQEIPADPVVMTRVTVSDAAPPSASPAGSAVASPAASPADTPGASPATSP